MEKKKMKQNKMVVAIIVITIMIFSIFSIPVTAIDDTMYSTSLRNDDYNNTNNIIVRSTNNISSGTWDNQPIPVLTNLSAQNLASNGYKPCDWGYGSNNGYYKFSSSNDNTYICMSSNNKFVLASNSSFYIYFLAAYNDGTPTGDYITRGSSYDQSSGLYFVYESTSGPRSPYYCPVYSNDSEAKQALIEKVNNISSSGDVVPLTTSYYTLDSGAYYKASENNKAAFALVGDIENGFTVVVGSIDPNCFIYKATESSVSPVSLFRSNNLNLSNFYSNQNAGMIHPSGIELSAFDTASDAEVAIYNYLVDEGGTPTDTTSNSLSYSLPPGNVMFIDISSAIGSITLESSSSIAGGVSQNEFNSYNNQAIGYLATFPDSFTLPLNGTTDIQWTASGNPTILGTYHKFQYTSAINGGGNQYLVIVNPTYDNLAISEGNLQADNPSATNSYIDIRCSAQNFYIFSLDAQISFSDGSWQLDSESSNTQFTGTYDPTTQTWNTTDSITGLPAQPTVGGANDIPTTDPAQAASNFTSWLKNFLSSFVSIFDAGKTAITTLVGYAQPFFNTIGSLYSWLPAPVYAVLVSGLTLVVIVGVIKVFL